MADGADAAIAAGIWWLNQPQTEQEACPRFALSQLGSLQTRLMLASVSIPALHIWLAVLALPDGRLHVAFLDVSQGDAILMTLPDSRQILIDGGPSPTDLNWRLGQKMPFWDRSPELRVTLLNIACHSPGIE